PHTGEAKSVEARRQLLKLIQEHPIEMVAVGNGTAGRETEQFIRQALIESARQPLVVMVSEAGASVYSASDVARQEFPDLDLTVRGAVSIARRLQDPLAELVKIDPKSIGVGQYQHDVNQSALKRSLDAVVESCVNFVGVELNTASPSLLAYVAGIGPSLAQAIVSHRQLHGPFSSRRQLLEVSRFGAKAFEQGAGFLRIRGGDHPLDATAVHPERYPLVERMASDSGVSLAELVQRPDLAARIDLKRYVSDEVGMPTLRDIMEELKKPGRDPRQEFTTTAFSDEIREMTDLAVGMVLPGVVTNVAAFGAFVDIGVHQDGLVHVSHLAHRFVRDPNEAVQVGDQVRVKVLGVDLPRKRISLSIKEATPAPVGGERQEKRKPEKEASKAQSPVSEQERWAQAGFRVGKKR
ncbi:MAG TPA: helix-hairpin-helix domain-containing protein, partial [Geobacterales bacterium]|nr:helix-hairpin-helix domain-containing protein [Geobacterales bacterium]